MNDTAHPIAAGQVWTYKTRPHEKSSRLIITKVESEKRLVGVVHIQITGLRMKNRKSPTGVTEMIGHLPYEIIALRRSVISLKSSDGVMAPFENGYKQWRSAFNEGRANVWTIPVAHAVDAMEAILNR